MYKTEVFSTIEQILSKLNSQTKTIEEKMDRMTFDNLLIKNRLALEETLREYNIEIQKMKKQVQTLLTQM
jgi:hypothetical protein